MKRNNLNLLPTLTALTVKSGLIIAIGFLSISAVNPPPANRKPLPYSTNLTRVQTEEIDRYLRQSNTVHNIVQQEVKDSLDRFLFFLGLLAASLGILGYILLWATKGWARSIIKGEIKEIKESVKSEFNKESLGLIDASSSLLSLVVLMDKVQFISDMAFSDVSTDLRQDIERYPELLKKIEKNVKEQALPLNFYNKLGDALSFFGKSELSTADSNHDEEAQNKARHKFEQAVDAYQKVIDNFKPKNMSSKDRQFLAEVLCKKGNALATLNNNNRAIAEYREALKIDNSYYWAKHCMGDALTHEKKFEEAIKNYEEALLNTKVEQKWRAETFYKLGIAYATKEDDRIAIDHYQKSLNIDPNNSWVLLSLGDSHRKLGEYSQAIQKYEEAFAINRTQYQSLVGWGDALCGSGGRENYVKAKELYKRALKVASDKEIHDYTIKRTLGNVYIHLEDYDAAIKNYTNAINEGDNTFKVYACRAYAREQLLLVKELSEKEKKTLKQAADSDRKKVQDIFDNRNSEEEATHLYDEAVFHALNQNRDLAIKYLKEAIHNNEKCRKQAKNEIGFIPIYKDLEFQTLTGYGSSV